MKPVILAALFAVLCVGSALAQEPTTGAPAVKLSTSELMRQQKAREGTTKPLMIKVEREVDRNAKPNPNALPGNSYTTATGGQVLPPKRKALTPAPKAPQTIGTTWTAATFSDTSAFPPDTMGAVGPNQFITAINGRIRSFNKNTGAADGVLNADPDVFFASVMTPVDGIIITDNFTSDPHIQYDRLTKRWFIVIIDVPNLGEKLNRILIAVSDAASNGVISNATVWSLFFIPVAANFADYPTLGIDSNALYIGANMFALIGGNFANTNAYVVRKSSLLSGGPIVFTPFADLIGTDGPFTPQGVTNLDASSTNGYFVGVSNFEFGKLIVRTVSTPGATPTLSGNHFVNVPQTAFPLTVPHLGNSGGTNGNLDSLDDRLFAAVVRNGSLWTAHNIGVGNDGVTTTTPTRNGSRWYELNNLDSAPALVQSGTVFDPAPSNPLNYWIPTVNISGQGHVALGCSVAGNLARANCATTGRLPADDPGTMRENVVYTNSTTSYNPAGDPGGSGGRRWGDYSYVSVDPDDDMTMYTIQEFCSSTNIYGVNVARLVAPPPATLASCSPPTVAPNVASTTITITGISTDGPGFFDPGPGFPNHLTASIAGGVTVNSTTFLNPTTLQLNISTVGASESQKNVTVTNPDGQSTTTANLLNVSSAPQCVVDTLGTNPVSPLDLAGEIALPPKVKSDAVKGTSIKGTLNISQLLLGSSGTPGVPATTVTLYLVDSNSVPCQFPAPIGSLVTKAGKPGKTGKPSKVVKAKIKLTLPAIPSVTGKFLMAAVDVANAIEERDKTNNFVVTGPLP